MNWDYFWKVFIVIIILVMLFGNRKVRIYKVIVEQLKVFRNAKSKKISIWDIICFIIIPIILSFIITLKFKCIIDDKLAEVLTTVFSLVFTVLFGFAAILVGKIESSNIIEKEVVEETFISIVSSTILSLVVAILSIIIIIESNCLVILILSIIVYSISFMLVMLILMITKRTFLIYCDNKN